MDGACRRKAERKLVVGLVGGMGSGKSRVAEEFRQHGARVVSGDELGHEALRQPDIREQIVQRWGSRVLDPRGEVDRRAVARIVFAAPEERKFLERLLHPWIKERFREEVAAAANDATVRLVVLDAAVMLEAGWEGVCDRLVFVEAPRELRLRRLAEQRGWDEKEVAAREQVQLPLTEKRRRADSVIANDGTAEELTHQVEALLEQWGIGS